MQSTCLGRDGNEFLLAKNPRYPSGNRHSGRFQMPKFSMLVLMTPLAKNIQTHNLCLNGGVVRNLFCYGQNPQLAHIVPHVFERPLAGWIQISLIVPQSFSLCNHPVDMDTELHKPRRTPKTLTAWVISALQLMSTCLDL